MARTVKVRISGRMKTQLSGLADMKGRSMAELVRQAIDSYVAEGLLVDVRETLSDELKLYRPANWEKAEALAEEQGLTLRQVIRAGLDRMIHEPDRVK